MKREHFDSYLYYIDNRSLTENNVKPAVSWPINKHPNFLETVRRNIQSSTIFVPIAEVFLAFLNRLSERNILLTTKVLKPSAIQTHIPKEKLSEVPNIQQPRSIEDTTHHWFQTKILQLQNFQYLFFPEFNTEK